MISTLHGTGALLFQIAIPADLSSFSVFFGYANEERRILQGEVASV
jgi:hypothetical protein